MVFKFALFVFVCTAPTLFSLPGYEEPWGKDTALLPKAKSEIPSLPEKSGIFTKIAGGVITFHQQYLSPIDGPRSHFRPTSSQYMRLAMRRHGFIKGFVMGCDRLLRENKEEWVYKKKVIDGIEYKWDPTFLKESKKTIPLNAHSEMLSLDEIADAVFPESDIDLLQ